jgi:D-alanyl-lipoteichoic acid acyltransferase DltB (MBOAT superfamily)
MLFVSPTFFAFFVVYLLLHFAIPARYRIYLVIGGSTLFYSWWKIEYVWLPYFLIAVAYSGVLWLQNSVDRAERRRRLIVTIALLFVPLVFFKYTDFVYRDVIGPVFGFDGKLLDIPLPLGVSFITFTLTAYVVDIYRAEYRGTQSAAAASGYVLFFPHLIAGPILRPIELVPQLALPRSAFSAPFCLGLLIFTAGLAKKLILADPMAEVVDAAYRTNGPPSGPAALLAIYGFSLQIYCDFSGYTDMAIGLALIIGIRLPGNFLQPYRAVSLVDFWRRWHITLSSWLRDYLYIPLGGSRGGRWRTSANILVTMVLGGLWHGASWTFVIWGLLHGVGIAFVHFLRSLPARRMNVELPAWLCLLLTFHFVTILWVFFRAPSLHKAVQVLTAPFIGDWTGAAGFLSAHVWAIMLIAVFFLLHPIDDHRRMRLALRRLRGEVIWPAVVLVWAVAITLSQGGADKFIYFDF